MEDLYHAIEVLAHELHVDDERVESCTVCIDDDDDLVIDYADYAGFDLSDNAGIYPSRIVVSGETFRDNHWWVDASHALWVLDVADPESARMVALRMFTSAPLSLPKLLPSSEW